MDANVRVGRSGIYGHLALEPPELIAEMDRFGIQQALVSHFTAEEYDASEGNAALNRDLHPRFVPAWAISPDPGILTELEKHRPRAVRLWFNPCHHNFSSAMWSAAELYEYLQQGSILTVISCEDLDWDQLASILHNFPRLPILMLDTGYRCDRYLFPLLRRFNNLYFDSSTYVAYRQLESFVEIFGSERIVFGSRLPLYTPAAALFVLATARISHNARIAIAGENLRRLLRMSET